MKAKLIKDEEGYSLFTKEEGSNNRKIIATTEGIYVKQKLSKQNCDEIFGIIDVEKLAEEYARTAHDIIDEPYQNGLFYGFMTGSKKTMELNKDKMFTLEDIDKAIEWGIVNGRKGDITHYDIDNFIQSLQQPTEIEVEIEMDDFLFKPKTNSCQQFHPKFGCSDISKCVCRDFKLDSNGCLILKRVE